MIWGCLLLHGREDAEGQKIIKGREVFYYDFLYVVRLKRNEKDIECLQERRKGNCIDAAGIRK